ncbi:MAG: DNA gyrase inhibitor YacG [bacterium]
MTNKNNQAAPNQDNQSCRACKANISPDSLQFMPFCCERCRLQDLSHWFSEGYRVRAEPLASGPDDSEH